MAGVAPAIARSVAAGDDDEERWARAAGSTRLITLATAAVSLLVIPLSALGLAPWRGQFVVSALLVAAIYAAYFALKCVLFALDQVVAYARWELACDGVFLVVLAMFAFVAPRAAIITFAIANGLFAVAAFRMVRARAKTRVRLRVDRRYAALATVATYTSVARLPLTTTVVGAVAGSRDAAGIAAIVAIMMPIFLVPQAAGMLTFAAFARAPRADNSAHLAWTIRAVAVCSTAVIFAMVLLARPVVSLLLGESYRELASSLVIVSLAALPQLVATPVGNAISGEGAVGINAALGSVALVVALAGAAVLAPGYHVEGAAWALAASMVTLGCGTLVVGRSRYFGALPAAAETAS